MDDNEKKQEQTTGASRPLYPFATMSDAQPTNAVWFGGYPFVRGQDGQWALAEAIAVRD